MKEFIEKLIGRLEEERKKYTSEYGLIDMQVQEVFVNMRKIVNQLAEEYIHCTKPCTDCEAYDLVKHNCPKFCKVIKETVEEIEKEYNNGWIPCSERLPNKEEYLKNDGRFIVTDGNRVYQSIYDIYTHHYFRTLKFYNFGASEKSRYEIDNCVIAWMPLPQPYTEEQKELSTTWQQQTMNRFERVE